MYIREENILLVFPETPSDLSASHFHMRGAPPDVSRWLGLEYDFV